MPTTSIQPSTARRIVLAALAVGVLVDILVPGVAAGVNAVLVVAAALIAAAVVAGPAGLRRMDPVDAWLPVAALAFAAMPGIRTDDWLVTADLLLAGTLTAGTIACLAGARITRGLVPAILTLATGLVVGAITGAIPTLGAARPARPADDADAGATRARLTAGARRATRSCAGSCSRCPWSPCSRSCSRPPTPCSPSSPGRPSRWRLDLDLATLVDRTLWVGVVAWGMAGLLAIAAGALPALVPGGVGRARRAGSARSAHPAGRRRRRPRRGGPAARWARRTRPQMRQPLRLGSIEAATVLWLVVALFAAFVVLQLAYLFGGRDTLSVAGLTYSDYARRGFFELVAVAVLAGTLVVALELAVARRGRAQVAASLALLGADGRRAAVRVRPAPALPGRLRLDRAPVRRRRRDPVARGGARDRRRGCVLARMTRWTLHALGILVLVTIGAMNVVGPQAFVTDRNLERAVNPAIVPDGRPDGSRRALPRDAGRRGGARHRRRLPAAARRGPPGRSTRSSVERRAGAPGRPVACRAGRPGTSPVPAPAPRSRAGGGRAELGTPRRSARPPGTLAPARDRPDPGRRSRAARTAGRSSGRRARRRRGPR